MFYNKTPQNINKILKKRDIKSMRGVNPKKGKSTNPEKIKEICEMAKQGKTAQEIADYYNKQGCKHTAGHIYTILDNQNIIIPRLPQPRENLQKKIDICNMFKNNKKIKEIAEFYKCSTGYISRILTENELRTRKKQKNVGYTIDTQGYKWFKLPDDDPLASMRNKQNYISEHRYVVARSLNRLLLPEETVHHINGNKLDNRIENLQLRLGKHGAGQCFKCFDCNSIDIDTSEYFKCNTCGSSKIKTVEL